jgi:5-methyltetrahydrofolate--homocysteine methyltransferase
MAHKLIDKLTEIGFLISDGATGTNLQQRGLAKGLPGEVWVLENPQAIQQLYKDFLTAGSDIILSCTFGASHLRLNQHSLADRQAEIIETAVGLAKDAIGAENKFIAGSMGPLGQLLQPLGTLTSEEAFQAYKLQAQLLTKAGVDVLLVETQFDLTEATVAIDACRSCSSLPIICSFSFDRGTRTMMGTKPEAFVEAMIQKQVEIVGINCGKSLDDNLKVLQTVKENTDLPIWFKPNAGLPAVDEEGNTVYGTTPAQMADMALKARAMGASIIGGCCGSTPEHIAAIADALKQN